MAGKPDFRLRNIECGGDLCGIQCRLRPFRQLRQLEDRAGGMPFALAHLHLDQTYLLFERDDDAARAAHRIARLERCEKDGASNRRMPCKGQFAGRKEDADGGAVDGIARLADEDRLRQVELARDPQHCGIIETLAVEHDRKRIAGEGSFGEDIERVEAALHWGWFRSSGALMENCRKPYATYPLRHA